MNRFRAWLYFRWGGTCSDSLLEYFARWGPDPAKRREAARLLRKRRYRGAF